MAEILIVDDEETLLATISLELGRAGHVCSTADRAAAAIARLESQEPELALVDIRLPDMDGLDMIRHIRDRGHDFPIIVMTAYGSVQSAVSAMKAGATDYLQKPVAMEELEVVISRVLHNRRLKERLDVFERERQRQGAERAIIGQSPAMRHVLDLAGKIASVPPDESGHLPTVLITGETGTGKDLIAHHLHDLSSAPNAPFVQINCTALPAQLVEAELFGYEKGAFTDAKTNKKGLFEVASEGTVFLDEIGDTPLSLQAKLLLVLEQRKFRHLGGTREREVRARTIAATNCDLTKFVAEGKFRKDLLFRFKSLSIELPPLRERGDDLFLLADFFIKRQAQRLHREPPILSDGTKRAMRRYPWPGNVRELDNVLQRAVLLQESGTIETADLNLSQAALDPQEVSMDDFRFPLGREDCTLASVERRLITQVIEYCNGNISEAARLLGLSRGALRHRMEKLALTV
ncbi:MAG: sigma-54 dependent transcriptional regulator [Phycisphaerales bacterium]|nr:sigma-54 dependent transcriptional regulator [Phycisphaerales bacterium]